MSERAQKISTRKRRRAGVGPASHDRAPLDQDGRIHAVYVGRENSIPYTEIERLHGRRGVSGEGAQRLLVLYGRVSGYGQQADLETQLQRL